MLGKRRKNMRAFFKSRYHSAVTELQNVVQFANIRLLGNTAPNICDAQSTCAKAAREIVILIERKRNMPHQNARVKEEMLMILDHEKLLTQYQCNVLALLTLQEAMRLLLIGSSTPSDQLDFLQEIQLHIRQSYSDKPIIVVVDDGIEVEASDHHQLPILEILIPKHVGHGMKYLEALKKHTCFNSSQSRFPA